MSAAGGEERVREASPTASENIENISSEKTEKEMCIEFKKSSEFPSS